jgi:hypothetical protein
LCGLIAFVEIDEVQQGLMTGEALIVFREQSRDIIGTTNRSNVARNGEIGCRP